MQLIISNYTTMNNWKDVPHLFANGKFKIEIHYKKDDKEIYDFDYTNLLEATLYPDHCRLFARNINDMSDEEIMGLPFHFKKEALLKSCADGVIPHMDFITLLDKGIYPFDQSHFEDGTVIDIKEFDNE